MNLRVTPRALSEAKRLKSWWEKNRRMAPDLFEEELEGALGRIAETPTIGGLYEEGEHGVVPVRRLLIGKTKNHVYYAIDGDTVVVLSAWGAPKGRGPRLSLRSVVKR